MMSFDRYVRICSWYSQKSDIYDLSCSYKWFTYALPLFDYWSSVLIRRIIYKFKNVFPFDYTAFAISEEVGIPLTD